MKPLISLPSHPPVVAPPFFILTRFAPLHVRLFQLPPSSLSKRCFPVHALSITSSLDQSTSQIPLDEQREPRRRTLYPGGYKRPEINVPSIVLRLNSDELLRGGQDALGLVDRAVAKSTGIVVLSDGEKGGGAGGKLYEAACVLKSVVEGRAYLLIEERVDIAAAVGASGVVLSDQGLPAIVARNTMMSSDAETVVLPLVARIVQSVESALNASSSEGADFLIYDSGEEKVDDLALNSLFRNVKIPAFMMYSSHGEVPRTTKMPQAFESGAGGLVITLEDLRSSGSDVLSQLIDGAYAVNTQAQNDIETSEKRKTLDVEGDRQGSEGFAGFVKLEDREKQVIETEKSVLGKTIDVLRKAAPLMEEVSLLTDAVSRIDEPFLLVIVGEFNSGKSTVINALLGKRYLKEGVVPTTNEITFLCYSDMEAEVQQRCQRHPDGQYICYLPAPILKDMNIVDTPGTNVILQRQQRLTEEFVPRADLLLFVISADRPLTESEVVFLRYTQQWKKKCVFVLNKSDIYRNVQELGEAISFIKENAQKLLNSEDVILYPVSARSALEAKLTTTSVVGRAYSQLSDANSHWSFHEFEKFLYTFLDGSSTVGMERIKLKLETPIAIAERLLSAAESLVRKDFLFAKEDLATANKIIDGFNEYAIKMENESISWTKQALSMIDKTKLRVVELIESTLQLSNFDLIMSYVLKGEKSAIMPATSSIQSKILTPALSDAEKLLEEYITWLQLNNAREGRRRKESFDKKWPAFIGSGNQMKPEMYDQLKELDKFSLKVLLNMSASVTSKQLEQEIREVFFGTFGGLGAAGLSASLLTSVLPTTLEDLLALGLCSAGGYLAIANIPARRRVIVDKVNELADSLAHQLEDAMQRDLSGTINNLESFLKIIGRPYKEDAQQRLDRLLDIQNELSDVKSKLQTLRADIQNLHVS